jgi:hypothetical protein
MMHNESILHYQLDRTGPHVEYGMLKNDATEECEGVHKSADSPNAT